MRALFILVTCLVLTGVFSGCGGSSGSNPPQEEMDALVKKRMEVKEAGEKRLKKK